MFNRMVGLLGFVIAISVLPARAQDFSSPSVNLADLNALTDARIAVVKAALQLTPEQAKYWPAVEDAMRARAQARYARIQAVTALLDRGGDIDPIELFRGRADALAQRAVGLKNLVDAWEPLYRSLAPDQKRRMRVLAARVMPVLSAAVDTHRLSDYDEFDDDVYVYFGDPPGSPGTVGFAPPH